MIYFTFTYDKFKYKYNDIFNKLFVQLASRYYLLSMNFHHKLINHRVAVTLYFYHFKLNILNILTLKIFVSLLFI